MDQMLIFITLSGLLGFALMAFETPPTAPAEGEQGSDDVDIDSISPEQKAEILGETPPEPEVDTKPPETPPEEKPPETPPAETPPEIKFTPEQQKKVDDIVKERLERDRTSRPTDISLYREITELKETVKRLTEGQKPPGPQIPTSPDEVPDIGKYLNDQTYNGWSMKDLKQQHPDHYEHCKTRIMNKMDVDSRFMTLEQRQRTEAEDREYIQVLRGKLDKVKELMGEGAVEYFTPDGKLTPKFKTDYEDWGVSQGIIDPLLAYQLKDNGAGTLKQHHFTEAELKKIKEDSANEAIKKLTGKLGGEGAPLPRVPSGGGGELPGKVTAEMDSETLSNIYADSKPGWQEAKKILIARGEMAA